MKKNKEKTTKIKLTKGEVAGKILGIFLVALMILSVCAPCVYYAISYLVD